MLENTYVLITDQNHDYIIEQGEETRTFSVADKEENVYNKAATCKWKYSKWNSGKIELWGNCELTDIEIERTFTRTDSPGTYYTLAMPIPLPTNVQVNSSIYAVCSNAAAGIWISQYNQDNDAAIQIRANAIRPCKSTVYPRIYAWSTWK